MAIREVTPFPEVKHLSALASPALQNLKRQRLGYVVRAINRTPTVLSQRTHLLFFQRGCNRVLLPSSFIFENTWVLTLLISQNDFMASSYRPGKEAEIPEVMEAFIPVVTRPIAGEPRCFRDPTN